MNMKHINRLADILDNIITDLAAAIGICALIAAFLRIFT